MARTWGHRLTRLVVLLTLSLSVFQGHAEAVEDYPPYSAGRMCYHYFWGTPNNYAAFCHYYASLGHLQPTISDPAAPFNAAAISASYGYLAVGGKEMTYVGPNALYLADATTATSIMEYTSGGTTTTVTASASISDVYRLSSPYWRGLKLCLKVVDWGSPAEYGRPIGPIGAQDYINPNTSARRTLTTTVSVPASRRFAIEVELDNTLNDGAASLSVNKVTCDGGCLPRTPNPAGNPGGGGGGGGCGGYGCY